MCKRGLQKRSDEPKILMLITHDSHFSAHYIVAYQTVEAALLSPFTISSNGSQQGSHAFLNTCFVPIVLNAMLAI